jgi:ribosomal protein S18 acetylase RimI-like enzyme
MSTARRAIAEDLPAIARIHRQAFFTAMPHMPVLHTPEEDLAFYNEVVFPSTEMWLIEQADAIVGFIAFRPGWIDHCYLHPDHQRRGLGTQLLHIAQHSNPALQLWTFQCNLPARSFYERHGFQPARMTDGHANEERQPDVLYTWTGLPEIH